MADNEETSQDELEGNQASIKMILGLSKSLFIKIVIGLIILLLAGGGYFFFMAGEDVADDEATASEELIGDAVLTSSSTDKDSAENSANIDGKEKIMTLREGMLTVREQNLELREQNLQLGEQILILQGEPEVVKETVQKKEDTDFFDNYGDDSKSFPPIQIAPTTPKPDPKFGEFKRPVES